MTQKEKQEVIRVCGENFEEKDIPTIWRRRDFEVEMEQIDAEEREVEELEEEKEKEEEEEETDL